ncbi:restriction endonuclease [Prescottella equi]|nr:restriction endonuclease [Prescottella equi]
MDVETGCTVIEVKKSLHSETARNAAKSQLTGYILARSGELGTRYVGILTDGVRWFAYHEVGGELREATRHTATAGASGAGALLGWLEGVLATKQDVRPVPTEIRDRLGASSSSHKLDFATLAAIYARSKDLPTVQLKRELWANLLRSALGTQFTDDDELFLEHTLLVNSAEIIAHLVLGLDAAGMAPATLLSGDQFAIAGLHGVVDRDFFDWVLEVPGGDAFVSALARRLSRFDWSAVEHDVLKVLYESVIPAETRKTLGEYYTPDWLAYEVVHEVVTDPINQRVVDPSCGSGSFLFYAVRHYLAAADDEGMPLADAMHQVSSHVIGIDLHPVAVALARVTYLLALGRDRLSSPERGELSVPVYLGDSLGWDQRDDLLSSGHMVIPTETGDQLLATELRFPDHLLADAARFDDLVQALVDESGRAAVSHSKRKPSRLSEGTMRRLAIDSADAPVLNENFIRLRQLHEDDRNHVWSYYIRNVARPTWLARAENRVDVLVGNPPWLSYRNMSLGMKDTFKELSKERGFWHNENTATHQDLAGLFIARAVERYLATGGRFAFVVPNSVVDRDYWSGFRSGEFDSATKVNFSTSWDLRRLRPHLFPRGSAVVFGTRALTAGVMPSDLDVWSGKAPAPHALAGAPLTTITRTPGRAALGAASVGSPYAPRFAQGANLVPRLLFRVESDGQSALGAPAGRRPVRSQRTVSEKIPWKNLPPLVGAVEDQFVWPTVLGEHVLPFRIAQPSDFVLPLTREGEVLGPSGNKIDRWPGLASWMRQADEIWRDNQDSKLTLVKQIDHMKKLSQQAPFPGTRVVYAASGMHVSAAVLRNPRVVVEHGVYWASVASQDEATFLVGILNAPSLTDLVRPHMSYGKDERHIDKNVWKLPIPTYDPADPAHLRIVELSSQLADCVAELALASSYFVTQRKAIRAFLADLPDGKELDAIVSEVVAE